MIVKKLNGCVCEELTGEADSSSFVTEFPSRQEVLERNLGVIGHSTEEDTLALLETTQPGRPLIVPFAGGESCIAMLTQDFRQNGSIAHVCGNPE